MEEKATENRHRSYLKEHEGRRYRANVTEATKDSSPWELDYKDSKYNSDINWVEINPNELVGELDEESKITKDKKSTQKQREEWFNKAIEKLKSESVNYCRYSHKGKCDHLHSELNKLATPEEKLAILKYYFPEESWEFLDTSLCGVHQIACPFAKHWRHGNVKELIEENAGLIIDVDNEKFKKFKEENKEKEHVIKNSSGITSEIVKKVKISELAIEHGAKKGRGTANYHCSFHDDKNPSLSLNDEKGVFKCFADSCKKEGNIVDFLAEAEHIDKKEAVKRLIERAGLSFNNSDTDEDSREDEKSLEDEPLVSLGLSDKDDTRVKIKLPRTGKLISIFAQELADVLKDKNILFFRADSREVVEIGKIKNENEQKYTGFISVKPSRFITLAEKFIIPGNLEVVKQGEAISLEFKPKSMTSDLANTALQSYIFEDTLLNINRIFTVPLPIIYDDKLTFPITGYDIRFKSWLPYNSPKIIKPEMSLEEAKEIIYEILKEFVFKSNQDYINAIAGLITPFLRGLYSKFNCRTPVFFYTANRERASLDVLKKLAEEIRRENDNLKS
ncbi:MAG: CHC2 zinc finger domain-containing protein [Candidatus Pacearchaeota archaeon]